MAEKDEGRPGCGPGHPSECASFAADGSELPHTPLQVQARVRRYEYDEFGWCSECDHPADRIASDGPNVWAVCEHCRTKWLIAYCDWDEDEPSNVLSRYRELPYAISPDNEDEGGA